MRKWNAEKAIKDFHKTHTMDHYYPYIMDWLAEEVECLNCKGKPKGFVFGTNWSGIPTVVCPKCQGLGKVQRVELYYEDVDIS